MNSTSGYRIVAAGIIGNVLEWYDFAIYGYFAAAIGRHFFPHQDPIAQLLSSFGIFAVGYLMRPVGGALIGHIGDRLGRRKALTFSVAAMAISTFLVGCCLVTPPSAWRRLSYSRCCAWCRDSQSEENTRVRWCF
jgi:MFS transporter, MHS family, proline/betaine transporter